MTTDYISIDLNSGLEFIHCGKLVADGFVHAARRIGIFVLIIVENGVLNIETDGVRYKVRKGEAALLPADKPHSGFRDGDSDGRICYFWAHFSVPEKFCYNAPCGSDVRIPLHFKLTSLPRVSILCSQLMDISKTASAGSAKYCSFLLSALACEISSQARTVSISQNKTVNAAASWLELHASEKVSLESVAAALGYNKRYLARIFREFMGITVNGYIEKCRMELAKNMLTGTDESIASIASETGYEDAGYFMRVFKRYTGVTCGEYRSSYTKMYLNRK